MCVYGFLQVLLRFSIGFHWFYSVLMINGETTASAMTRRPSAPRHREEERKGDQTYKEVLRLME